MTPEDIEAAFQARYARLVEALRTGGSAASQRRQEIVARQAEEFVAVSTRELSFCAGQFVQRKIVHGVFGRTELVIDRWPRPSRTHSDATAALHELVSLAKALPPSEPPAPARHRHAEAGLTGVLSDWPPEAAPLEVARWARDRLNTLLAAAGDEFVDAVEGGLLPADWTVDADGAPLRIPASGLAVLYLAEQDVRAGLKRPSMAIDASKAHHAMVGGMRDWPKDGERHRGGTLKTRTVRDGDAIERVELLTAGSTIQLQLPMPEIEGVQDTAVEALRRLRGAKGLRHWAALQRLFSVEGGRTGRLRWFLDEHLEAMGYDERQRRDPKVRADAAMEVEALAAMELAIYTKGGVLRERRRLLLETGRFEAREGSEWKLDGIEFQFNERVYGGVRESTGEIGRNWMPAPIELAKIDHVRHPYAHALGLLIAIRFRWRLNENADSVDMTGERLLRLAGIPFEERRAERGWSKLRRSLDELVRVGQLARYEWTKADEAWTNAGICQLFSAQWLLDRAARGILPDERPPALDRPATGAELKTWRERRGWSQREVARRLKVSQGLIYQAEQKPNDPLSARILAAVSEAEGPPVSAITVIDL